MNTFAEAFRERVALAESRLRQVEAGSVDRAFRPGGWSRKEILGHLVDSAANNRQRFVRAAIAGSYAGPGYEQDRWVALLRYQEVPWRTLVDWWRAENAILTHVVQRIPANRFEAECIVDGGAPTSLRELITGYLDHLEHHVGQIAG